jgi:hypothetical protein
VTLHTGNSTTPVHRAHARGQIVPARLASSHGRQPHRILIERRSDGQTDAQLGLISEDPIGFAAGDTNVARYVGNGVTTSADPSGLEEVASNWDKGQVLSSSFALLETDIGTKKAARDNRN